MKTIESNPKRLAHKVIEQVRKGNLVNLQRLSVDIGYSPSSAVAQKAVRTKQYKAEIAKLSRPILEGMIEQINKIKDEIMSRNLNGEDTRTLTYTLDTYIKNYQLLSGGATERQVFVIPSEVMERNNIMQTKDINTKEEG
jgi:hypothetical protein